MEYPDVLYECLERLAAGGDGELEACCERHPEHAGRLRREIARLRRLGLVGPLANEVRAGPPDRLGGFQLVEVLGEGGMGIVYAAEELALGRRVALKMLRPEQLHSPDARARFRREVETVARLQHPGIVPVYAVGEDDGVPYFTMEPIDGCTLADVVDECSGSDPAQQGGRALAAAVEARSRPRAGGAAASGALFEGSWTEACLTIARDVAEALEYAHGRGLVHRDVKPSNIALTRAGRAMLLDFGLTQSQKAERLTRTGSQPGSLPYMSPEQVAGVEDVDGRTDVYSLGITLYELLTLTPAFEGTSLQVMRSIERGEIERPRARRRGLAADVETVVMTAVARERGARYASAGAMARDLGHLLAHRPIEASPPGIGLRALRFAQRHPRWTAATLAAVPLALAALASLAWIENRRSAEILRLADVRRLVDLETEAERLWPAHPGLVGTYDSWLKRAEALRARLDLHRSTLAALEHADGAVQARDGAPGPAGDEARWQHDTLQGLIRGIEKLADPAGGAIADVRERLAFARTIENRSRKSAEASARWAEATGSIADPAECPLYAGLALAPQIGLLPIGRDGDSGLWEFADLHTGSAPLRDDQGKLVLAPENGIVFVLLPGGRYRMGSIRDASQADYDPYAIAEEEPAHAVDLAPFFMGKHLVTQAQWQRLSGRAAEDALHPVAEVSWIDAERFLARIAAGLPTEAQWEYAARAGTRTPWWTGATKETLRGAANLLDAAVVRERGGKAGGPYEAWLDDGYSGTCAVDALRANPFGLHDVAGNLLQWCRDSYAPYTNAARPGDGARAPAAGVETRVYRGGQCAGSALGSRSAYRNAAKPTTSIWVLGLRAARAIER